MPSDCNINPSNYNPFPGSTSIFGTLTSSSSAGQVILSGTAVAGETGNIQAVGTSVALCAATVAPANCTPVLTVGANQFTRATLTTPVSVSTGQTIAVTVVISFS